MIDPGSDIAAVFDAHVAAEFTTRDLDATMATMTDAPHLTHVPVMTGGQGRDEVRHFYGTYFIGHWPADLTIAPVSRTIGVDSVVDEVVLQFTHDIEMPAILPGVAPTVRRVEAAFCVVVGFKDGKVSHEHIYWDQASILVQIGLLDPGFAAGDGGGTGTPLAGSREGAGERADPRRRGATRCLMPPHRTCRCR